MKKVFFILFFIWGYAGHAQDSVVISSDLPRQFSFFSEKDTITRNDYLLSISKVFQAFNEANVLAQPVPAIQQIRSNLNDDDSILVIVKERLNGKDKNLRLRNLQMLSIILKEINRNAKAYAAQLNKYDSIYDTTRRRVLLARKDTLFNKLIRSAALRDSFKTQLQPLGDKLKKTDSLMKAVNLLITDARALTSDHIIMTNELQLQAQGIMATTARRIFGKEGDFLWQFGSYEKDKTISEVFKKSVRDERKIAGYYFTHTNNKLLLLLVCGLVFFFWVFYNYESLKKRGKLGTLDSFNFRYIRHLPVFASLILMLNLAPLFDLDAPFVYIATVELLLMLTLTYSFRKRLSPLLFYSWLFFIILFLLISTLRYLRLPDYFSRWLILILNTLAAGLGIYIFARFKNRFRKYRAIFYSVILYIVFNLLAIIANALGRVSLTQIFGSTGTYAFIQTAGLVVFVISVTEAFLLQIHASRVRKEYTSGFDQEEIGKRIGRIIAFFSIIIWLIVFFTNLNIYNFITQHALAIFEKPRNIGSFSFTLGGVILFIFILYAANWLQKYVGYFFGNIGNETIFDNPGSRSRLMVFKLVLLIAGFLLAIAASGLALDKITVILGALSVGIGLGLQNIVNNFVSGIILLFDQSLHIGDTVEIGPQKGRVRKISMRSSTLLTNEGAEVIIPNGTILSQTLINWSLNENYIRVELSYNVERMTADIRQQILEIIKECPEVVKEKEPQLLTNAITSTSTQVKIYFWVDDVRQREKARSDLYEAVSRFLEKKEIKIL